MKKIERTARKYLSMSCAFKDGAECMLKRVLKHLKTIHPDFYDQFGEEIRKAIKE